MNTFTWLLIGHLLGDWLLQNDWMARGKKQSLLSLAGMMHVAIYTATIIGAFWLSGLRDANPTFYLSLGAIILISHWLIDATDITERWMRLYRQSDSQVMRIMVDQTLHLLVLAFLVTIARP